MKTTMEIMLLVIAMTMGISTFAQDRLYKEGSVWSVQFVKTNTGMGVDYINSLKTTWKASMDNMDDKWDAISKKVVGDQAAMKTLQESRVNMRTINGGKLMCEIVYK